MLFRKRTPWPSVTIEEIRKRARLLVIDDGDFAYLPLFQRDGYTIDKWADVTDLSKLESGYYDIIMLDLQGVGRQVSAEQGLGVLRHLRETRPAQLIIAYSGADWPLKYQEFFTQADAVLPKGSDYVIFKRKVDSLLEERFSLGFYIRSINSKLDTYIDDKQKLERMVRRSIRDSSTKRIEQFLKEKIADPQVITTALTIVQTALQIAALWKS